MKIIKPNPNNYGKWKDKKKFTKDEFVAFKKFMIDKYASKFSGKNIFCVSLDKNIYIEKKSLSHGINSKGTIDKTKSLSVLDKLIHFGLLKETKIDYKDTKRIVLVLEHLIEIDKQLYSAEMIIKENEKGKYYYHHDLLKIKKVS